MAPITKGPKGPAGQSPALVIWVRSTHITATKNPSRKGFQLIVLGAEHLKLKDNAKHYPILKAELLICLG